MLEGHASPAVLVQLLSVPHPRTHCPSHVAFLRSWDPDGSPSASSPTAHSLHLVVDVEIPLILILHDHTRLLQQEVGDLASIWFPASAELDLKVLALNPRESH